MRPTLSVPLALALALLPACRSTTSASVAPASEASVVVWHAGPSLKTIADLLAHAERGTLAPMAFAPLASSRIDFRRCGRDGDGHLEWGPLERIELEPAADPDTGGRAVWVRRVGEPGEQRIVLCEGVAPLGEGELENGLDDDGDGLIDEPGLSFVVEHAAVTVGLTLVDEAGRARSARTRVRVDYAR